jgi:large subunit ribosomal protein L9
MEIILLEPINANKIGEVIKVKAGYARNFLIPMGKAVRATDANREKFEREKAQYVAKLNDKLEILKLLYDIINNQEFVLKAKASSNMRLFGSINISQIFNLICDYITQQLKEKNSDIDLKHFINKSLLIGNTTIKALGVHEVGVRFSTDLIATVKIKIENEGMVESENVIDDATAAMLADAELSIIEEAVEQVEEAVVADIEENNAQ